MGRSIREGGRTVDIDKEEIPGMSSKLDLTGLLEKIPGADNTP